MDRSSWIRRAGAPLAVALMLASAAVAQGPPEGARPRAWAQRGPLAPVKLSDYWLGVQAYPVPPVLRAHLNVPEDQGLVVEEVFPESPAAKAGLKLYDVLLKAGDKPLKDLGDLMQAINGAKDKDLALAIVRGGKPMTITAKLERRPAGEAGEMGRRLPPGGDWDAVKKWLDQMRPEAGVPPMRFRFFHPGTILPPGGPDEAALPANTTISITKQGKEPAKITVTRGKEKWEVTEKELDKLPADLRPHVQRMLGRGMVGGMNFDFVPEAQPGRPDPVPEGPQAGTRLERRLDEMNRQIERLHKQLDEMRGRLPGTTPPKPEKPTSGSREQI